MNKDELLAEIRAARGRLEAALDAFSDAQMLERVDGEWTRKDVLAHIDGWERRVNDRFEALVEGLPGDPTIADDGTNAFNAELFEANRGRSLGDVQRSERKTYGRLISLIESATDAELFDGSRFAWTKGQPFYGWFIANSSGHYDEHLEQLTRAARPV